jgi:hypothetical protein
MIRLSAIIVGVVWCGWGESGRAAEPAAVLAVGEWSEPVTDSRGYTLQARLVVGEKWVEGLRETPIYVELRDASDSIGESLQLYCEMGKSDFRPEYKGGLWCELRDRDDQPIENAPLLFGGAVPQSEWLTLPTDGLIRVRASPFGIRRAEGMALCPHLGQHWVVAGGEEYFLSGTFTIDPAADLATPSEGHVWRGTLVLPAVKLVPEKP